MSCKHRHQGHKYDGNGKLWRVCRDCGSTLIDPSKPSPKSNAVKGLGRLGRMASR